MAARSRFLSESRNHDKRDDFTVRRSNSFAVLVGRWKAFRRRRIILALLGAWLLYLFFRNMPTDVPPVSERYDRRYGRLTSGSPGAKWRDPPSPSQDAKGEVYEGPIKFEELGLTLRNFMYGQDGKGNVLFAVAKLESIPKLLPIACSMAQHNRSRPHLAFMGRQVADWEQVRAMNGIAGSDCDIQLHDARPNFAARSSKARLQVSAQASLGHMHSALQLHAVLAIDSDEDWLVNALRAKATWLDLSLVTLPARGVQGASWIASLDAASIAHFDKIQLDIVIQAQPESAASLLRLLKSIRNADYSGWTLPRLTIELPPNVDPFLSRYLSEIRWPADGIGSESRLVVRHRLDTKLLTPMQSSIRTVESFFPLAAGESHVLFLDSNVELSPNYYHFLMYTLLEYKYGAGRSILVDHLMGISLALPQLAPDEKTKAPWLGGDPPSQFTLWQAPSSTAALYFGDRWLELHTFLAYRLWTDPSFNQKAKSTPGLSHKHPSWLQPVLEMMQAQGYYMLYPTFMQREGSGVVTAHRELAQRPEEYLADGVEQDQSSATAHKFKQGQGDSLTADDEIDLLMKQEQRLAGHTLLPPLLGELVMESTMPLVSFGGDEMQWADSETASLRFAEEFATSVGGCGSYDGSEKQDLGVRSLFCLEKT